MNTDELSMFHIGFSHPSMTHRDVALTRCSLVSSINPHKEPLASQLSVNSCYFAKAVKHVAVVQAQEKWEQT